MKKKVSLFGKEFSVFALVAVAMVTLASAALLPYYGLITGMVTAEQSVLVDGKNVNTDSLLITDNVPEAAPGGEEFCFKHFLENKASVSTTVEFENSCVPSNGPTNCDGVEKIHYVMPEEITLELCSKDSTAWQCDGRMNAELVFKTVNPTFDYTLTATGLQENTEYALIYYADKEKRFAYWGGDNPGKVINTFNTATDGTYDGGDDVEIGMNLPTSPDKNIDEYNYCLSEANGGTGDMYAHCHGAKIWIVPVSDLTAGNLPVKWNPTNYLYEKDMITYFDCDIMELTSNYPIDEYGESVTGVELASGEEKPFFNCYDFAINIMPGTYTMETGIKPTIQIA